MKLSVSAATALLLLATSGESFVVQQPRHCVSSSTTPLSMGLFDYFNEDARKEREARKQREYEEQERLQQQILERRNNPEKMEEYEAKTRVRRNLRMAGLDDAAQVVTVFEDEN